MKLRTSDDSLIISIYILSCVMLVGQFMGINVITSFAFAVSFIIVFLGWVLHLEETTKVDILAIVIIVLSLLCAVTTYRSLSMAYFRNWSIFSAVFLYFSLCIKIRLKETTIKALFKINFIMSMICILFYIFRYDKAFYVTNMGVKYLKFDFYNPNVLALFLVCIAGTGMLHYAYYQVRFKLVKNICYTGIFMILILQTLSRTALLAFIFFAVASVVFVQKKYYYLPKSRMFSIIVSLFPLLFAIVYMSVIENIGQNSLLSFMVLEGKGLDSRQYVWEYAFELFKKSPFIGSYGYVATSSEFSHMHNSHLNVLVSYGSIVFVLVVTFIYTVLKRIISVSKGTPKSLAVWALIMCLLLGAGEAVLFSGGLSFYLLAGQFILFSNANLGKREKGSIEEFRKK